MDDQSPGTVWIVLGYGIYDPTLRTDAEMQGLEQYFRGCAREIARDIEVAWVILCGGRTNPASECSEAASMLPRFQELFAACGCRPAADWILLSETSHNTAQNIFDAFRLIQERALCPNRIVIACDTLRVANAQVIDHYLRSLPEFAALFVTPTQEPIPHLVLGFDRPDIHPQSTWLDQLARATAMATVPRFIQAELQRR